MLSGCRYICIFFSICWKSVDYDERTCKDVGCSCFNNWEFISFSWTCYPGVCCSKLLLVFCWLNVISFLCSSLDCRNYLQKWKLDELLCHVLKKLAYALNLILKFMFFSLLFTKPLLRFSFCCEFNLLNVFNDFCSYMRRLESLSVYAVLCMY